MILLVVIVPAFLCTRSALLGRGPPSVTGAGTGLHVRLLLVVSDDPFGRLLLPDQQRPECNEILQPVFPTLVPAACAAGIALVGFVSVLVVTAALVLLRFASFVCADEDVSPVTRSELKQLESLILQYNQITDAGCATITAALDLNALPSLDLAFLSGNPVSVVAYEALRVALQANKARRPASIA